MSTASKRTREKVIRLWTSRGIEDFYIGWGISDEFPWYSAFFYAQGLEKICKAYFLGKRSFEYESLSETEARKRIDKIVREYGHSLSRMIEQIISDKKILLEKYPSYADKNIKVVEKPKIEILEQAYTECRYPVPVPISRYYKITKDGSMGQYPFDSSDLEEFAFKVGNTIIQRIGEDYSLSIKRESPISPINETSWEVFSSLFFKDTE